MSKDRLASLNAVLWMTCMILGAALVTVERSERSQPPAEGVNVERVAPQPIRSEPRAAPPAMEPHIVLAAGPTGGPGTGRDPFRPPGFLDDDTSIVTPPPAPHCWDLGGGALTDYELDSLKLEGIAQMPPVRPHALVASPNGRGVILRVGDVVGRECARVERIDPDAVSFRLGSRDRSWVVTKYLRIEDGLPA